MFKEARIKLTAWYLLIIMLVSFTFSAFIYKSVTREFSRRFDVIQRRFEVELPPRPDPFGAKYLFIEDVDFVKNRVLTLLVYANLVILGFSGMAGYFLAGRTLEPIKKNMDEQKEFVDNASHELRTPLTVLKSEIEVSLRDKKLTLVEAKKILESNLEEVNKMQKLSNYLLTLNRYQSGGRNITFTDVDLKKVAMRAIGKNNVKTDLINTTVKGDEDTLVELTEILIDNAFKYSGENPKIEVTVTEKTLEVKDNGIGISKADLPHIFERFYRGDKSRNKDGYGLGLSIAKQIADLHVAKLTVESKPGKGSSFKLLFS